MAADPSPWPSSDHRLQSWTLFPRPLYIPRSIRGAPDGYKGPTETGRTMEPHHLVGVDVLVNGWLYARQASSSRSAGAIHIGVAEHLVNEWTPDALCEMEPALVHGAGQ